MNTLNTIIMGFQVRMLLFIRSILYSSIQQLRLDWVQNISQILRDPCGLLDPRKTKIFIFLFFKKMPQLYIFLRIFPFSDTNYHGGFRSYPSMHWVRKRILCSFHGSLVHWINFACKILENHDTDCSKYVWTQSETPNVLQCWVGLLCLLLFMSACKLMKSQKALDTSLVLSSETSLVLLLT